MYSPLIGITGFTSKDQVSDLLNVFKSHRRPHSKRKFHVGVMMSYGTLHDLHSRFTDVFPRKDALADILTYSDAYKCLHYAYYRDDPNLSKSLDKALSYGGDYLDALQLDMCWPKPKDIARAVENSRYQNLEVILQIGRQAFEAINEDPSKLVEKLKDYTHVVDRVLLDKSMGEGKPLSPKALLPFMEAISSAQLGFDLVVGGGLGPRTMDLIEPILKVFPHVSFDAQGALCPDGNYLNPLDLRKAEGYLIESLNRVND